MAMSSQLVRISNAAPLLSLEIKLSSEFASVFPLPKCKHAIEEIDDSFIFYFLELLPQFVEKWPFISTIN